MTKPQKNLAGAHFLSCSLALLQLDKSLFKLFLLALQTYCNILLLWIHVVLQLHYLWIWTCGIISIQSMSQLDQREAERSKIYVAWMLMIFHNDKMYPTQFRTHIPLGGNGIPTWSWSSSINCDCVLFSFFSELISNSASSSSRSALSFPCLCKSRRRIWHSLLIKSLIESLQDATHFQNTEL